MKLNNFGLIVLLAVLGACATGVGQQQSHLVRASWHPLGGFSYKKASGVARSPAAEDHSSPTVDGGVEESIFPVAENLLNSTKDLNASLVKLKEKIGNSRFEELMDKIHRAIDWDRPLGINMDATNLIYLEIFAKELPEESKKLPAILSAIKKHALVYNERLHDAERLAQEHFTKILKKSDIEFRTDPTLEEFEHYSKVYFEALTQELEGGSLSAAQAYVYGLISFENVEFDFDNDPAAAMKSQYESAVRQNKFLKAFAQKHSLDHTLTPGYDRSLELFKDMISP